MISLQKLKDIWDKSVENHKEGNYMHLHCPGHWDGILKFWKLKYKIENFVK